MSDVAAGAEHSALPQDTPHTQGGSQQGEELQWCTYSIALVLDGQLNIVMM